MEQAKECACDEGFITVYSEDGKHVEGYKRTGLGVHDCDYVRWRNSKISEAEAVCRRQGIPPEGLPFLKIMEGLCDLSQPSSIYEGVPIGMPVLGSLNPQR